MAYEHEEIAKAAAQLKEKFGQLDDKRQILRAPELTALYERIKEIPAGRRASFGKEVNKLKAEIGKLVEDNQIETVHLAPIDVTAPFDTNIRPEDRPALLPAEDGTRHPLMSELETVLDRKITERKKEGLKVNAQEERYRQAGFIEQKRYKGLGEMDAEQLFETTMNPEKRVLVQVKVQDAEKADAIFNKLMGTEVELRKNFIQTHAKFVKDLDI